MRYGQTPPSTPYSPLHYAIVFGVGMLLAGAMRVPLAAGAALYTVGFWIRGRPETYKMLESGAARASQFRVLPPNFRPVQRGAELGYRNETGAGVRVGSEPSNGVHVGPDVIDAGTF